MIASDESFMTQARMLRSKCQSCLHRPIGGSIAYFWKRSDASWVNKSFGDASRDIESCESQSALSFDINSSNLFPQVFFWLQLQSSSKPRAERIGNFQMFPLDAKYSSFSYFSLWCNWLRFSGWLNVPVDLREEKFKLHAEAWNRKEGKKH